MPVTKTGETTVLESGVVIATGDTLIEVAGLPSPVLVKFSESAPGYAPGPIATATLPADLSTGWVGDRSMQVATGDVGGRATYLSLLAGSSRPGACLLHWTAIRT